jgi:hypothetical protein
MDFSVRPPSPTAWTLCVASSTPGDDTLEAAIQTRLGDLGGGKYRRNTGYVLRRFANYLRSQHITESDGVTAEAELAQDALRHKK